MTTVGLTFSYNFLGLHEHLNILLPILKSLLRTLSVNNNSEKCLSTTYRKLWIQAELWRRGQKRMGKRKLTATKRLLVPGALLIQICYSLHFLSNHVKSQIACPNSLVHHRDNTGTQNYLSPKPCPLDLPELSGTHYVKPLWIRQLINLVLYLSLCIPSNEVH